jgi:hypothetical protein
LGDEQDCKRCIWDLMKLPAILYTVDDKGHAWSIYSAHFNSIDKHSSASKLWSTTQQ